MLIVTSKSMSEATQGHSNGSFDRSHLGCYSSSIVPNLVVPFSK